MNRNATETYEITLTVAGAATPSTATRSLLTADSILTRNTWNAPDTIRPVDSEVPLSVLTDEGPPSARVES